MADYFFEVDEEVLQIADEIIKTHHPWLKNAKIGFVFRDEAPTRKGKITMGQAQKVSPKFKPHLELDFLIWLAKDIWDNLSFVQKNALIDHELSHCGLNADYDWTVKPHDVEEFWHIIQRYGLWNENLQNAAPVMERALQMDLPEIPSRGALISINTLELGQRLHDMGAELIAE